MATIEVHRQGKRVAAKENTDNAAASMELSQLGIEVLYNQDTRSIQVHRQGKRVAAKENTDNAAASLELSQLGIEVLGRALPMAGTPLARPSWNDDLFMHNWISKFQIHTRYDTSITVSAENRAEERVSLLYKPHRSTAFQWTELDRTALDQVMLNLRGMASETWACPLYGDQIELTEDFTSGLGGSVFSLYCEPLLRRFPAGIRIAVVNLDPSGDVNWVHFTQVLNRYTDRLDVSSDMPYDTLAGRTLIYPCLDMEPVATASVKHISSTKAIVNVTAQEMIGDSALPPSWTGIATGFGSYDGLPIFAPDHNWVTSLDSKYSMDGSLYNQGRGKIIDLRGAHPRLTQKFNLQLNRTDAYRMLNFFDSRLGRAIPFWTIDSEDLWEVDAVATGYVDITAVGDFTKMQEDFDYVGLKFYEDESQVKAIHSFQDNGATWRIVLDDNLPSGLSVNNVLYCSRARKSRFLKDSLSEVWVNDGICEIMVQTIELLQEGSVSL